MKHTKWNKGTERAVAIQIQTQFNHAEMEKQFCYVYLSSWRKALGASIIHTLFMKIIQAL